MQHLKNLSKEALRISLIAAADGERSALVTFLYNLDEYDTRRLYEEDGYSSLFKYLVSELNLSEPAAAKRLQAMRLLRRWPSLAKKIASGHLHLTGLYLAAKYLTEENHEKIFEDCSLKSKAWIEDYLGRDFGRNISVTPKRDVVRHVASPVGLNLEVKPPSSAVVSDLFEAAKTAAATKEKAAKAIRISTDLDAEAYADLRRAQELLGGKDLGAVIGKALKLCLTKIDPLRKKCPVKRATRSAQTIETKIIKQRSRYVPKAVVQAVHRRDAGRCTYQSPNGHRCDETAKLQLDHRLAYAKGGAQTIENLQLRCAAHNRMTARQEFGSEFVAAKIRERVSKSDHLR